MMSSITPLDMLARAGSTWFTATAIVVGLSTYFSVKQRSSVSLLAGVFAAVAASVSMLGAGFLPYCFLTYLYPAQAPLLIALAFAGAGFLLLWLNSLLIQGLQNVGFKLVGAKKQPIRWYQGFGGNSPVQPRRRNRRREQRNSSTAS
jgi:hypothetical protein